MTKRGKIGKNDSFIANSDVSTISQALDRSFDGIHIQSNTRGEFKRRKLQGVALSRRRHASGETKHRIHNTTSMVL